MKILNNSTNKLLLAGCLFSLKMFNLYNKKAQLVTVHDGHGSIVEHRVTFNDAAQLGFVRLVFRTEATAARPGAANICSHPK